MTLIESILLGILQGLTEFLPVSSSGHLELASALFGIREPGSLQFTMAVHGATVLSTIVVFWKEIGRLLRGFFQFRMNHEMRFMINIFISMIPIGLVGLFFKDRIEALFTGNLLLVGSMLLVTALLLTFSNYARPRGRAITPRNALLIGLAQACAVLPGLSRSGATISTGLLLGIKREEVAKFSFLMVLIPILGMNFLELIGTPAPGISVPAGNIIAGFLAAFITGTIACKWMISLVSRGKLIWFAVYCAVVGIVTIGCSCFNG